jgi:polyisoprenyl-phosphate glycosyltransferase
MRLISIVTPCYNEEKNVKEVYEQVKNIFTELPEYTYEHIFIDNASLDKTIDILREIAKNDKNVKVIVNLKNFGALKSPYYALMQSKGEAVIQVAADLQDPPVLIKEFIKNWEDGYKIVVGVKPKSEENPLMFAVRKLYYNIMKIISVNEHIKNFTSYALYDKDFINILRRIEEPAPYIRGLVTEFGFKIKEVPYIQPKRKKGKSAANFYILFDIAMLGFVNNSKVPLRLATFIGIIVAIISFLIAVVGVILKLIFWDLYPIGISALITGIFFFSSVQLFFIGIVGEYVGAIYTEVKHRPLVIERERINFD